MIPILKIDKIGYYTILQDKTETYNYVNSTSQEVNTLANRPLTLLIVSNAKDVIKELKKEEILYYDSIGYKIVNGEYRMTNTYYCRMEDKDKLDSFIELKRKDKNIKPMTSKEKNKTNLKRSLKQKINKLNKKENKTEEEKLQLEEIEKEYETLKK